MTIGVRRRLVVGGAVIPTAAIVIGAVAGLVEPGYSPIEQHVSGLAAVPATTRWLMTLGFMLAGVGLLVVATALSQLGARIRIRIALALAGLSLVMVGLLPRSCVPVECADAAWHHLLHDVFSGPVFASLIVVPLFWSADVDRGASPIIARGVAAATAVLGAGFVSDAFPDVNGLVQRGFILVPTVWLVVAVGRLVVDGRAGGVEVQDIGT